MILRGAIIKDEKGIEIKTQYDLFLYWSGGWLLENEATRKLFDEFPDGNTPIEVEIRVRKK